MKGISISELINCLESKIIYSRIYDPSVIFDRIVLCGNKTELSPSTLCLGTASDFNCSQYKGNLAIAVSIGYSDFLPKLGECELISGAIIIIGENEDLAQILLSIHRLFESNDSKEFAAKTVFSFSDLIKDVINNNKKNLLADAESYLSFIGWKVNDCYYYLKIVPYNSKLELNKSGIISMISESSLIYQSYTVDSALHIVVNMTKSQLLDRTELEKIMIPILQSNNGLAGSSNRFINFRHFDKCKHQVDIAIRVGEKINPSYYFQPFSFYSIYYLLEICSTNIDLMDLVHPLILQLYQHDQKNGTEYVATLHAFFNSDRKIQKAADHLFIHKNTFIYRMEKIRSITGVDFTNDFRTVNYMISCSICKLIKSNNNKNNS